MYLFLHLCSTNDRFANPVAASNHHLLSQEDLFCGNLDAHVSTGNHDTITGLQDLIKTVQRQEKKKERNTINTSTKLWKTTQKILLKLVSRGIKMHSERRIKDLTKGNKRNTKTNNKQKSQAKKTLNWINDIRFSYTLTCAPPHGSPAC